ncbi:MAG: sigma-70 family RNA polymerase sigma factor [Sedimentisphaerales bacterium]|nr:sigma-70 family RNA polymerase sigma factor [Sedimentisphaerales bacterium]
MHGQDAHATMKGGNLDSAYKQTSIAAYSILVKEHYRTVFALCMGMLGNVHDAEDIAQEAMLKGFQNIDKLDKNVLFRAWIMKIAKNLCIDFIRRRKKTSEITSEQKMESKAKANENHDLQNAIQKLPQELRLPLTMFYFEQKNAKVIASILEISHSGTCQKIRDAIKMLHEILTERVEK